MEKNLVANWAEAIVQNDKPAIAEAARKLGGSKLSQEDVILHVWKRDGPVEKEVVDAPWIASNEPKVKRLLQTEKKKRVRDELPEGFMDDLLDMCTPYEEDPTNNIENGLNIVLRMEIQAHLMRGWYIDMVTVKKRARNNVSDALKYSRTQLKKSKILYDMATTGGMHRLRWLRPDSAQVIPMLISHSADILEQVDLAKWSENIPNPVTFAWIME